MLTANILTTTIEKAINEKSFPKRQHVFVIGVKGDILFSVERLLERYPQLQVVKRFPEQTNVNYLHKFQDPEIHILQPTVVMNS